MSRIAVVLFNLGGPDSLAAVRAFLKNLFSDPAIIAAPGPVRWLLARLIAGRRAPVAREIYAKMGGRSPIVDLTRAQAEALERELGRIAPEHEWRVTVAMRYWHPFAAETVRELVSFAPERVVLLPLYPQYSTTTTGSSIADWQRAAAAAALASPTAAICCWPEEPGFVDAVARLTDDGLARARSEAAGWPLRMLFSAHGLPKRVIAAGDPYQWQVERSVAAVTQRLESSSVLGPDVETVTCYQSRVGPLEWIGPATDTEITRAGRDGRAVVVVPIAFVSEHSETLVELDIEYRQLAERSGVPAYVRVPTVATDAGFIAGLARLAVRAGAGDSVPAYPESATGSRICPESAGRCAMATKSVS